MTQFNQPTKPNYALTSLLFAASLGFASTVDAALMSRLGGQAVYDTDRNITWLADANYAQTSGYDADGLMNWTAANAWAASLNIGGYTGWRLPTTLQPDPTCSHPSVSDSYGYNCTGSELGHLFYSELGATFFNSSLTGSNTAGLALFINIQSAIYWSDTEYAPIPTAAWFFDTSRGLQEADLKGSDHYAWAVRDGDVGGAGTVPEPSMIWLFSAGALAWSGTRSRRRG